jgi:hypothetical protein
MYLECLVYKLFVARGQPASEVAIPVCAIRIAKAYLLQLWKSV